MKPSEFRKKWSRPSVVDADIAIALGLYEAHIISTVHYWCLEHEADNKKNHFNDGAWWNYVSYDDWQAKSLPFMAVATIKKKVLKLEKMGVLISGNFNRMSLDKTKWYRIDYTKLNSILSEDLSDGIQHIPSMGYSVSDQEIQDNQAIPETTTETNTDIVVPTEVGNETSLTLDKLIGKNSDLKLKAKHILAIAEEMGIEIKRGREQSYVKLLRDAKTVEERHQMLKNWIITKTGMLARRDTETGEVTVRKTYQEQTVENIMAKRQIDNFKGLNSMTIPEDMANLVNLDNFKEFVKFVQGRFPDWKPIEADFKAFQYRILELGYNTFAGAVTNVFGVLEHTPECKYWGELSPSHFLGSSKLVRDAYEDKKLNARKFPTLAEEKRYAIINNI